MSWLGPGTKQQRVCSSTTYRTSQPCSTRQLTFALMRQATQQPADMKQSRQLAAHALTPASLFTVATAAMIPAYALLMVCPSKWRVHRVLTSHALPVLLCLAWLTAMGLAASTTDSAIPDVVGAFVGSFHASSETIAGMFTKRWFTCLSWMQLLLLDFVLAREVVLDAADLEVFAAHSIVLCFMCGPVGYLSHQLTKAVYRLRRPKPQSELNVQRL